MILANSIVKLLVDYILVHQSDLPNVELDKITADKISYLTSGIHDNRLNPLIVDTVLENLSNVIQVSVNVQSIAKVLEENKLIRQ